MRKPLLALSAVAVSALVLAGCSTGGDAAGDASSDDATISIGSLYEPQNLSNTQGGG